MRLFPGVPPVSPQRIPGKGKLLNNLPANQMLLNDAFQNIRRAGVIPNAFRINDRNRPMRTNPQAVDLGAIDQRLRPGSDSIP